MTLTYVPNFFDILPMYMVVLAMLPLVVVVAQQDRRIAAMLLIAVWAVAATGALDLPAQPWLSREGLRKTWFFNPFSWQLIFFTGFAFMRGWLPAPTIDRRLMLACVGFVLLSVPLAWWPAIESSETLMAWSSQIAPLATKTHFGVLRFMHFLALAYIAYAAAGEQGKRLSGPVADVCRQLGQQSLAVFMSGLVLSFVASIVLNMSGRGFLAVAAVNLGGIGVLIVIARIVAWFKSSPWLGERKPAVEAPVPAVGLPPVVTSPTLAAEQPMARTAAAA